MKRTIYSLLSMAFICAMTLTSCDEIMSKLDNPVDSYLKVDAEVFVKEGSAVKLYAETISDAEITYTVGDEKIAKVEKVSNHEVKVIGVKPGETVIDVKLAANAYYKAGEAKVKVVVDPTYTLKDAVVAGAKLKIGYKFNGKDCLFAYEYDAEKKAFNLLPDNSTLPEGYFFILNYNGDDKITQYLWDMNINKVLTLNLYTGGSFDRIYKEPCEMTSLQVNNYEMLPYVPESVTPIADLQAAQLPDEMSTGDKGSFAVIGVIPQNATNQVIKYSSSNTAVITIDAAGNFECVAAGKATIKAEATDGSGKFAEQEITVTIPSAVIALSAVTTADINKIVTTDGYVYASPGDVPTGKTAAAKIAYVSSTGHGLALALADESGFMQWLAAKNACAAHTPTVSGGTWSLPTKDQWNNMMTTAGNYNGLCLIFGLEIGDNPYYWSITEDGILKAWVLMGPMGNWNSYSKEYTLRARAVLAF